MTILRRRRNINKWKIVSILRRIWKKRVKNAFLKGSPSQNFPPAADLNLISLNPYQNRLKSLIFLISRRSYPKSSLFPVDHRPYPPHRGGVQVFSKRFGFKKFPGYKAYAHPTLHPTTGWSLPKIRKRHSTTPPNRSHFWTKLHPVVGWSSGVENSTPGGFAWGGFPPQNGNSTP